MFDEATLEKITMELLTNLGYETLNGYELERENYSNVILDDDLERAITRLNKNITRTKNLQFTICLQVGIFLFIWSIHNTALLIVTIYFNSLKLAFP